jgi:two-component system chemotaxis response regulator CheV
MKSPNEMVGITGDILLDAGTNELEVLIFTMHGAWFGVNVAKVREVIRPVRTFATPGQHPSVVGMFNIRGSVMPVVDLAFHMGLAERCSDILAGDKRIIITEFNGHQAGFVVDTVDQIHRLSWEKVKPSPDLNVVGSFGNAAGEASEIRPGSTTGTIELDGRIILMIDFESVADSILHEDKLHIDRVENEFGVDRASKKVIVVEDSSFMRGVLERVFRASGYDQLRIYPDGASAWEAVLDTVDRRGETLDAVVSDIEMPRMDGLALARRIREHSSTRDMPIVLFSSLISKDNLKKGEQVGVNAQIAKPELADMVRLIDRIVSGESIESASVVSVAA